MFLANFVKVDMVKLKKNRELGGMVTKKKSGIRKSGNWKFRELGGTTVPGIANGGTTKLHPANKTTHKEGT